MMPKNSETQIKALELLKKSGKSNYLIAKETGISEATIGNYLRGKTKPTPANAKIILEYFNDEGKMLKRSTVSGPPISTSTNEDRLWAMIDFLKQQIKEQQETINTLSRTNEDLTKKVGNGVQFHAAKAGE